MQFEGWCVADAKLACMDKENNTLTIRRENVAREFKFLIEPNFYLDTSKLVYGHKCLNMFFREFRLSVGIICTVGEGVVP